MHTEPKTEPVNQENAEALEPIDSESNGGAEPPAGEELEEDKSTSEDGDDSAAVETEATDWQNRYLRLYAEFDNYRKRTMRERVELIRSASRDAIEKLIPVLDDFERAIAAQTQIDDVQTLKEGQSLIHTKLKQILEVQGVQRMEVNAGDTFNVDIHEAITRIPAPSPELSGKVVDVVEAGYLLNDAVIRYAKVVVGE